MLPPGRPVCPLKDFNKEEEKEIKDIVGSNSGTITAAESIPDELFFEILLRLPAQDIYYPARLVCQKWYHMVHSKYFIKKHLEHASYGLIYSDKSGDFVFISSREDGGGIDTYKLNYTLKIEAWVFFSSNGLMLEREPSSDLIYSATNILTGQAFRLPPFPYPNYFLTSTGIGYDAASMKCKVVVSYYEKGYGVGCAILTVGVDKTWRRVCIDHLSHLDKHIIASWTIITEGFVHWHSYGDTRVLTLNLETEIIAVTPPPIPEVVPEENIECHPISTGRYLSLFLQRRNLLWEIFEMKPEIGEWRKLPNISLEGLKRRIIEILGIKIENDDFYNLKPWGWLKYPEVLALRSKSWENDTVIFYNLITREIGTEKLSLFKHSPPVTHQAWSCHVD